MSIHTHIKDIIMLLPSAFTLSSLAIQSNAALFELNSTSASPNESPIRFLNTSHFKTLPKSSQTNCHNN